MKRAATRLQLRINRQSKNRAFLSKVSNFYFALRPPGQTPGQEGGARTRHLGQLEYVNPRGSPGGGGERGWSGLELTDT